MLQGTSLANLALIRVALDTNSIDNYNKWSKMRTYTVQENTKITPSTLLLTLQRDDQERPLAFQPGQYAAISFEHKGKKAPARCFSIVSPPTDQDTLQFSTRIRGHYTSALSSLQKDDIVNVYGPFGGFVLDVTRDKKAVFLAGGIGITPFISMLRYLNRLDADNQISLLYSCQTQDDIAFDKELLSIEARKPNLKTTFVIGKGPIDKLPNDNAATGFISAELLDKATGNNYAEQKFFICGPPGFMKTMVALLVKKGVARNRILTEAFTQSSPRQTSILRSWPANVYALSAIGVILGSLIVGVSDLLRTLPPTTPYKPTDSSPFLLTTARQKQLDQLVNTIPPSPNVITPPSANQTPTYAPSTSTTNTPAPTFAPIYVAPAPRTTVSTPPP
ncbi:MAG TPA: FAD-binding oxidoreductase [Candidatus Dormibacteraeota bacterium]|nr:FAD-binding oxidoreductase [Candidatus Dormibacteraeota bacterium]